MFRVILQLIGFVVTSWAAPFLLDNLREEVALSKAAGVEISYHQAASFPWAVLTSLIMLISLVLISIDEVQFVRLKSVKSAKALAKQRGYDQIGKALAKQAKKAKSLDDIQKVMNLTDAL